MIEGIISFIIVIAAISLLFKIFGWSIKVLFKLIINAFFGGILLLVFNFIFAGLFNLQLFEIPITWLTAMITGILGVPGVILLLIFRFI